jgi:hypothetical protein
MLKETRRKKLAGTIESKSKRKKGAVMKTFVLAATLFFSLFTARTSHAVELETGDTPVVRIHDVQFFQKNSVEFTPGYIDFYARKMDSKVQFIKCKEPAHTCEYVWKGRAFTIQEIANGLNAVSSVGLYDYYGAFPAVAGGTSAKWYRAVPFVRGFAKHQGAGLIRLLSHGGPAISQGSLGYPSECLYLLFDVIAWYRNSFPILN